MRNVTVEFADGTKHVYQGVPDEVTPDDVIARAQKEFSGKQIVHLDGGRSSTDEQKPKQATEDGNIIDKVFSGVAGIGASVLDTAGDITSGFGAFENPVSKELTERAKAAEEAAKTLGGESAFNVGEAVGTGMSFGTGFGAGASLLGKSTKIVDYLSKGGRVKRAFGRYLKEAGKSPVKAIGTEAAVNAAMAGAGKSVEEATGSGLAGFGVELAAGLGAGMLAATRSGLQIKQGNHILNVLADYFRRHPETLANAEETKKVFSELGIKPMIASVVQDPIIKGTMKHIAVNGTDDIRRSASNAIQEAEQTASEVLDRLVKQELRPEEASVASDIMRKAIEEDLSKAVGSLDQIEFAPTREEVSQNFHDMLQKVNTAAEEFGSHLYGAVKGDVVIPPEGIQRLKEITKDAVKTDVESSTAKKVLLSPEVKKYVAAIRSELGFVKKGEEKIGPPNVAKLAELRSNILSTIRTMDMNNERATDVRRLRILADGIDEVLESIPDSGIRDAANFWRQYKQAFANSEWASFFKEHAGDLKESPARLVAKLFLGPDKIRSSQQLKEYLLGDSPLAEIAREQGFTYDKVREIVKQGLLAELKRTTPDITKVTPERLRTFKVRNKALLQEWNLEDDFKKLVEDARQLKTVRLDSLDADRLALAQYGVSDNISKLKADANSGDWKKVADQLRRISPGLSGAYKRTLFRSLVISERDPKKLVDITNTYGKQLLDKDTYQKVSKVVNMIASPPKDAKVFDAFRRYFSRPDIEQATKSVILDRLRRISIRFINLGLTTHSLLRNKAAQEKMFEYIFTPEGTEKVLAAAKKDPMTKTFLAAMFAARHYGQKEMSEGE